MWFLVDFGFVRFSILGVLGGFAVGGEFLHLFLFGVLGLVWVIFLDVFSVFLGVCWSRYSCWVKCPPSLILVGLL